jgi:SAM-dependent methyltransferase
MQILNLGSGQYPIKDAINVDVFPSSEVDVVMDFSKDLHKFKDGTVDGIYMLHSLEHIPNDKEVLKECYRILRPGGFIYIAVPHSSRASSIGDIGHYRTYSGDSLKHFLSTKSYLSDKVMFKTIVSKINFMFYPYNDHHPYIKFRNPRPTMMRSSHPIIYFGLLVPGAWIIQKLIDLSPRIFEHFWCFWVGGASEVMYYGEKI